jgi:uncharacterized protein DUF6263
MKTHRRSLVCLAVLCIAAGSPRSAAGQDVTLRYRWTKGEELRYRTTLQTSATASGTGIPGGPGGSVDQTMTQVIRTIVDDVSPDGTATLRQVIESVRIEMNNPMGKMVFDSTATSSNEAANPFSQILSGMYSAMIGQSITVVTSPTGAIQKIEGMARLMDNMLKNMPQAPAGASLLDDLRKTFSDDAAQDFSARGLAQFPDRPLKPGDVWDDRFTAGFPMFGAITTSRTSTFQGVESRGGIAVARITAKLTMKSDPAAAPPSVGPFTMQMGESTGDRELLFDVAKGRMQRVTTAMSQVMTMSGTAPGGQSLSMQTPTKSTMTLELLDAAGR